MVIPCFSNQYYPAVFTITVDINKLFKLSLEFIKCIVNNKYEIVMYYNYPKTSPGGWGT